MATAGILNGTSLLLYVDVSGTQTPIAFATSGSLSLNMDTRETTNKQSSGWRELLESTKSWTMEAEGFHALDATNFDFKDLYAKVAARTAVSVQFSVGASPATGDYYYSGSAYITSISLDSPLEDSVTFSCSFEGTGVLTETTP
jgi:TP901-1 family phage major tail protein